MSSPVQAPTSDGTGSPVIAPPISSSAPPVNSLPPVQSPVVGSPLLQAPPVEAPVLGSPPVQSPAVQSPPVQQAPPLVTPVASPPPPVVSSPPPTPVVQLSPPPAQNFASPPPPVPSTPPPADTTPPPSDQSAPAPPPPESPSDPPPARRSPPPEDNSSPAPAGPPRSVDSARAPPPAASLGSPPVPLSFSPPVPSSASGPAFDPKFLLPPPTSQSSSTSLSSNAVIGLAAGGVAIFALVAICLYCLLRRKPRRDGSSPQFYVNQKTGAFYDVERRGQYDSGFYSTASSGTGQPLYQSVTPSTGNSVHHGSSNSNFSYEELAQATGGFSRANMLGEGGFGCVYKGILPGGQEVAVKQLKIGGGQGEREFRAEVEIITRIHHRHLVTLVGYCIDANHRLLVYEFVPNDTLDYHLHGKGKLGKAALDWTMRMKIAVGSSRGLAYLHEDCHPKIIHRDIKTSNILLDNNYEAQVADFGLAKLANDAHTHVTTRVMGTFGYLAPEYASSGKLTDKSDVYSFGVVLLELITGRKPVDTSQPLGEESLVEWSRPLMTQALETGNFDDLVDPLLPEYNSQEMLVMIRTAAACVRHSASKRPKMSQIVRILESDSDSKGGFNDLTSTEHDTALHTADLRMFRKMALGTSQEYGSEYSGATSEYGVNPSLSSGEFDSKERAHRRATDESEWPLRH